MTVYPSESQSLYIIPAAFSECKLWDELCIPRSCCLLGDDDWPFSRMPAFESTQSAWTKQVINFVVMKRITLSTHCRRIWSIKTAHSQTNTHLYFKSLNALIKQCLTTCNAQNESCEPVLVAGAWPGMLTCMERCAKSLVQIGESAPYTSSFNCSKNLQETKHNRHQPTSTVNQTHLTWTCCKLD